MKELKTFLPRCLTVLRVQVFLPEWGVSYFYSPAGAFTLHLLKASHLIFPSRARINSSNLFSLTLSAYSVLILSFLLSYSVLSFPLKPSTTPSSGTTTTPPATTTNTTSGLRQQILADVFSVWQAFR